VTVTRAVDHVSKQSIDLHDPNGNLLEIYYELPTRGLCFLLGRGDREQPLVFND
jgi:hypothetical protein